MGRHHRDGRRVPGGRVMATRKQDRERIIEALRDENLDLRRKLRDIGELASHAATVVSAMAELDADGFEDAERARLRLVLESRCGATDDDLFALDHGLLDVQRRDQLLSDWAFSAFADIPAYDELREQDVKHTALCLADPDEVRFRTLAIFDDNLGGPSPRMELMRGRSRVGSEYLIAASEHKGYCTRCERSATRRSIRASYRIGRIVVSRFYAADF